MSNITDKERVRRLHIIDECKDEGLSDSAIAEKMNLPIMTIKRGVAYLEDLRRADLSPEETSAKRGELYLKLSEAAAEAVDQFSIYKDPIKCPNCKGKGFTTKEVTEKDKVIEIEIICSNCKGLGYIHNATNSNKFLVTWVSILEKMGKLYGFDNVRPEGITFNQQNITTQTLPEDKVDYKTGEKLKKLFIDSHERSVGKPEEY